MKFIYTKAFAIFSGLLVVVFIITFLEVKGLGAPIRSVVLNSPRPVVALVKAVTRPVGGFFSTFYRIRGVVGENAELQSRVHDLEQQVVGYDQARRENEALKKELGFVSGSPLSYIACTVIAENPLGLSDTMVINCGSDAGVQEGLAVVSQGYLVGKIAYASKDSSTVLLVTNYKFSADARISKSGASGVAKGSYGSGIVLDQLSQNDETLRGDLVVTAGINDQVPKNILIGEIGEVLSSQNELFKKTTLLNPLDFSNLQFVFVVK